MKTTVEPRPSLSRRAGAVLVAAVAVGALAWAGDGLAERVRKTSAAERALRRAYDGAPPVIPHARAGADCTRCHSREGMPVPDLGFAPPSPHEETGGMSAISRCEQCHVYRQPVKPWRASTFRPLRQDLRRGQKDHMLAPPVIPHKVFMRENCAACHSGPAAREEIRSSHPERQRCRQCHVEQVITGAFARSQPR